MRLLGVIAVLSSLASVAHEATPVPDCQAPVRPPDQQDTARWNAFVDAVDAYRACMNAFIQANHLAASQHREAANQATQAWNAFVRASLNVPRDYPWPPVQSEH